AALQREAGRLPPDGEAAACAVAAAALVQLAPVAGAEPDVAGERHVGAEAPAVRGPAVGRAAPVGLGAERHGLEPPGAEADPLRVGAARAPHVPAGADAEVLPVRELGRQACVDLEPDAGARARLVAGDVEPQRRPQAPRARTADRRARAH